MSTSLSQSLKPVFNRSLICIFLRVLVKELLKVVTVPVTLLINKCFNQ